MIVENTLLLTLFFVIHRILVDLLMFYSFDYLSLSEKETQKKIKSGKTKAESNKRQALAHDIKISDQQMTEPFVTTAVKASINHCLRKQIIHLPHVSRVLTRVVNHVAVSAGPVIERGRVRLREALEDHRLPLRRPDQLVRDPQHRGDCAGGRRLGGWRTGEGNGGARALVK